MTRTIFIIFSLVLLANNVCEGKTKKSEINIHFGLTDQQTQNDFEQEYENAEDYVQEAVVQSVCNGTSLTSSCCSSSSPCQIGGGVCSSDDQCEGSLKCGQNFCHYFHPDALTDSSCCYDSTVCYGMDILQTGVTQEPINITSPNYPDNYGNEEIKKWKIVVPDEQFVRLEFNTFNTEAGYDHVQVYDGCTTKAPFIGRYSGDNIYDPIVSTGATLLITFMSDGDETRQGFSATVSGLRKPIPPTDPSLPFPTLTYPTTSTTSATTGPPATTAATTPPPSTTAATTAPPDTTAATTAPPATIRF